MRGRMIGGLLRFAPGRLGARTSSRALVVRESWMGCVVVAMSRPPQTSWNPRPAGDAAGLRVLS